MTPTPHPQNTNFEWVDHAGPFRVITDDQARAYDRDGYFVLEEVLPPDLVDAVVAEIDPLEQELTEQLRTLEDGKFLIARAEEITFTTHLVRSSEILRTLTRAPALVDLCADLIGPDVRLYWDQAVYKKPGTVAPFPWHQDNGYAFVEPQQYLTCWIALTDATVENGCPWVVPGLHRQGTLAHAESDIGYVCLSDPDTAVAVPARRGSVVVFSSLTPHCTGGNASTGVRKAYIIQYGPTGAEVVRVAPGGAVTRTPADDEQRQYEVLRRGLAVAG